MQGFDSIIDSTSVRARGAASACAQLPAPNLAKDKADLRIGHQAGGQAG